MHALHIYTRICIIRIYYTYYMKYIPTYIYMNMNMLFAWGLLLRYFVRHYPSQVPPNDEKVVRAYGKKKYKEKTFMIIN